jgi:hypothetical protein
MLMKTGYEMLLFKPIGLLLITFATEELDVTLVSRTTFRPRYNVIEVYVLIKDGLGASSADLIVPFKYPELHGPRNAAAYISKLLCLCKRLSNKEDRAFMPKDSA